MDTGATELDGIAVRISVRGTPLWLAGVAVEHEERAAQALSAVSPDEETIFLYHYPYPDVIPASLRGKVDLLCAGHVHGGQVALPWYGALVTLSKYGKQYEAGLYRVAGMAMYVSRGLGMEGGSMPRIRFFARPELAIIEIQPTAAYIR
jgi:predicted MPP superfamily phosphohydrolase